MFLRRIRPRGRGRRQEYCVLLESYRTPRGSRQRVVAYLGKLPGDQLSGWADGSAGAELLIRCVTRPDDHVQVLLGRLGMELPNHLRRSWLGSSPADASRM